MDRALDAGTFVALLVVEDETEPRGYAIYALADTREGSLLWETSVAIVAREYLRDRGLSRRALGDALSLARERGDVAFIGVAPGTSG